MCRSPSDLNLVLSSDFNKMLVVELFVVGLVEQMMDFFSLAGLRLLPMENRPLSKAVSEVCEMILGYLVWLHPWSPMSKLHNANQYLNKF